MNKKQQIIGIIYAIMAALCWGIATVMSKGALTTFPPVFLLCIQLVASVLFLWSAIAILKIKSAPWKDIIKFGSLGFLEPFAAYFLGLVGLSNIEASQATLIQSTEAIMIILLLVIFFKYRIDWKFYALSLIALIGVLMVLGISTSETLLPSEANFTGSILVFLGTVAAALYVVLSSRFVFQTNPILIVAWQQSFALLLILPFFIFELVESNLIPSQIDPEIWLLAISSGIIQYALSFSLYLIAMRSVNMIVLGNMLNMVPVFGLAGAFLFLGERFIHFQIIGAGVTIIAIILIGRLKPSSQLP